MPTVNLSAVGYSATITAASTNYPQEFTVYNTNINTISNGGCACVWTVPAGTTFVTFEIWGGGGGGAGSCCCMQTTQGAGAGGYAVKTVYNQGGLGGCVYCMCAGGSSGTQTSQPGCSGNPSYVTGYGLTNFCACGGAQGCTTCNAYSSCYTCQIMTCCSYACGGDIVAHGLRGSSIQTQFCHSYGWASQPTAPATVSGPFIGPNGCNNGGCTNWTYPPFPGGGGYSAHVVSGGCCQGMWGAGGLISVTYG